MSYEKDLKDAIVKAAAPKNTAVFDEFIEGLTMERGITYGTPLSSFERIARGTPTIAECKDAELRHALYMIWVKICRLVETPTHRDSILDIAGYARTMCMIMDERQLRITKRERCSDEH